MCLHDGESDQQIENCPRCWGRLRWDCLECKGTGKVPGEEPLPPEPPKKLTKICPIFTIVAPLAYLQNGGRHLPGNDYTCCEEQCAWWLYDKCAVTRLADTVAIFNARGLDVYPRKD